MNSKLKQYQQLIKKIIKLSIIYLEKGIKKIQNRMLTKF